MACYVDEDGACVNDKRHARLVQLTMAVERPRRRTRDARPQAKYTAAAVRSSGGLAARLAAEN
jgi:hypothetical protein